MTAWSGANWRPVDYHGLRPRQPRKAAILHTNGGGSQLFGWWKQRAAAGSTIGAQYQVFADGRAECYVDPDLVVYHAFGASTWAFGIETEDDGNPATPWTDEQVATIAAILRFHDVPAQRLTSSSPGDGVGYHAQYTSWNQSAHACPGTIRISQIDAVLAAMTSPEADMPLNADDLIKITQAVAAVLRSEGVSGAADSSKFGPVVRDVTLGVVRGEGVSGAGQYSGQALAAVAGLQAQVNALVLGKGLDPAAIEAAARKGAAEALANAVVTIHPGG